MYYKIKFDPDQNSFYIICNNRKDEIELWHETLKTGGFFSITMYFLNLFDARVYANHRGLKEVID